MRQLLAATGVVAAVVLGAGPAHAQVSFDSLNVGSRGSGTIRPGKGAADQLTRAVVDLEKGGAAEFRVFGDKTYVFTGRWTGGKSQVADLNITGSVNIAGVTGAGKVYLTRAKTLSRLDFTGRNKAGDPVTIRFQADDDGTPTTPGTAEISDDLRGTGRLNWDRGQDEALTRAVVRLAQGGAANIRLVGKQTHTLVGRWRRNDADTITVDLTEGFGNAGTDGSGTIQLTGGKNVDWLALNGTSKGERFRVSFDADADATPTPDRLDLNVTRGGEGSLDYDERRDDTLTRGTVQLRPNHEAILRFTGGRQEYEFRGRWTRRQDRSVNIRVDQGLGSAETTGTGVVMLNAQNNTFQRVNLSGNSPAGRYRVAFDPHGTGGGGGAIGQDTNLNGRGTLSRPLQQDERLTRASVVLRNNRDAVIRFTGARDYEVQGKWSQRNDDRIRVEVERINEVDASGGGYVYLTRGNRVDRVALEGLWRGLRYAFNFDAEGGSGGVDGDVTEEAAEVTRQGSGRIRVGDREPVNLSKVHVELNRNGSAVVRFHAANDTFTYRGRWSGKTRERVTVDVQEFEDDPADGTLRLTFIQAARLRLSGGLERVEGSVRSRNRNITVNFDLE